MPLTWKTPNLPRSRKTALYENTAPYATYVHEGVVLKSGTVLPARRFMRGAFHPTNLDAPAYFADHYRSNGSIAKAFDATVKEGQRTIKRLITTDVHAWPRATVRSTGEVVRSPRDIVDTGNLLKSQKGARYV